MSITGDALPPIPPISVEAGSSLTHPVPTSSSNTPTQICGSCHKPGPPSKYKTCEGCRIRFKGYRDARALKQKNSSVSGDASGSKVKLEEDTVKEPRKCRLCRSILSEGYQYKLCTECRERTRKYQAERARQKRAGVVMTDVSPLKVTSDINAGDTINVGAVAGHIKPVVVEAGDASWETIRAVPEEAPDPPASEEPESEAEERPTKEEDRQSICEMDEDQARQLDSAMQVDELEPSEGVVPATPSHGPAPSSPSENSRTEQATPIPPAAPSSASVAPTNTGSSSADTPPPSASSGGEQSAPPPASQSSPVLTEVQTRPCTACRAPVSLLEKFKLCLACRLNRRDYQRVRNQKLRDSLSATRSTSASVSVSAAPTTSLRHPSLANYQASVSAPPSQGAVTSKIPSQTPSPKRPPSVSTGQILQSLSTGELNNNKLPYTTQPLSLPPPQSISTPTLRTEMAAMTVNDYPSAVTNHTPTTPQQQTPISRKRGRKPKPSPPIPSSSSGKRCNICKAWLLQGYDFKLCALCREKGRKYQNERNEKLRAQQGRERSNRGRKRRRLGEPEDEYQEVDENGVKMEVDEDAVKMEEVEGNLGTAPGASGADGKQPEGDKGSENPNADSGAMDIDNAESSRPGANITVGVIRNGIEHITRTIASYFRSRDQLEPSKEVATASTSNPTSTSASESVPTTITSSSHAVAPVPNPTPSVQEVISPPAPSSETTVTGSSINVLVNAEPQLPGMKSVSVGDGGSQMGVWNPLGKGKRRGRKAPGATELISVVSAAGPVLTLDEQQSTWSLSDPNGRVPKRRGRKKKEPAAEIIADDPVSVVAAGIDTVGIGTNDTAAPIGPSNAQPSLTTSETTLQANVPSASDTTATSL